MADVYNFPSACWEDKGSLEAIDPEVDGKGKLVPKVRVIDPGLGTRKSGQYLYLLLHGLIEDLEVVAVPQPRTFCALPLGVAQSHASPESLLAECLKLNLSVRRTAGAEEKLVIFNTKPLDLLSPWKKVLAQGAVYPATKICNSIERVPLEVPLRMRPLFLTITVLSDSGFYQIPRPLQEFRVRNGVSFNLLFHIALGDDLESVGIKGVIDDDGQRIMTVLIHLGNFIRKRGKTYTNDYCKRKIERMKLTFALGAVGGASIHIKVEGKISKRLFAQIGFRNTICYPIMEVNPSLNKLLWKTECHIKRVQAVLQPSVPDDFRIYNDIVIDHSGKILRK
ncbi:matrix protein [Salem virus]|uniref:Matrix protein n=1 Tax=Salem virus TaxID=120499 RepID=I6U9N2_9MONO|nr:matrix protein [Salem virus]AFM97195.1 matrix protein [Salem virus]